MFRSNKKKSDINASSYDKVEVLLSIMNRTDSIEQIIHRTKIKSKAVIINQCSDLNFVTTINNGDEIKYLSIPEKGVGLSRNNALLRSSGDFLLFADEDEILATNYDKIIMSAFEKIPDADMIIFNIVSRNKNNPCHRIKKTKRVHRYNSLKYGAPRIAVKRSSIQRVNISFSLLFGGGAKYSNGEDSIFIYQSIERGLRVYTCPDIIGSVGQQTSTWFNGYNDKFFKDKGVFFWNLSKRMAYFYCLLFVIRGRGFISSKTKIDILRLMDIGIKEYKLSEL